MEINKTSKITLTCRREHTRALGSPGSNGFRVHLVLLVFLLSWLPGFPGSQVPCPPGSHCFCMVSFWVLWLLCFGSMGSMASIGSLDSVASISSIGLQSFAGFHQFCWFYRLRWFSELCKFSIIFFNSREEEHVSHHVLAVRQESIKFGH